MTDRREVFIPCGQRIDPQRLSVRKARTIKYRNKTESCQGDIFYLDEDGEEADLLLETPKSFLVNGIHERFAFGSSKEEMTQDKVQGYEILLPLTSKDTIEKPTEEEATFQANLDMIYDASFDAYEREADDDDTFIPHPSQSTFSVVAKKGRSYVLKPIYDWSKLKDENEKYTIPNHEYPQTCKVKIQTRGKGNDITCQTPIYRLIEADDTDVFDDVEHVSSFTGRHCHFKGVIYPECIYYGSHGKQSWGASIRMKLTEGAFKPVGSGAPRRRRRLQQVMSTSTNTNEEDEEFSDPFGGSAKNKLVSKAADESSESSSEEEKPKKSATKGRTATRRGRRTKK